MKKNECNRDELSLKEICCRYKALVETSPDCIKLFDTNGNLLYINPAGIEEHNLKNLKNAINSGWNITDSVIEEDKLKIKKAFEKAIKNNKTSIIEIRHTEEGSDRDVCLETITPVNDDKGKLIGIFGVSRDISKTKKIEKIFIDSEKKLKKEVGIRTKELMKKIGELERINKAMVERELKMIELKKEISKKS